MIQFEGGDHATDLWIHVLDMSVPRAMARWLHSNSTSMRLVIVAPTVVPVSVPVRPRPRPQQAGQSRQESQWQQRWHQLWQWQWQRSHRPVNPLCTPVSSQLFGSLSQFISLVFIALTLHHRVARRLSSAAFDFELLLLLIHVYPASIAAWGSVEALW